ncbi:Hypothetical_protein [Hexamita inflata]|uniref:Hypothetical_protein n=1 Tax=Hexamita inflata TaxID=28002 RepID=A0AA86PP29_9EUKA|nr:Hypothetical protein HINF_LOCUS26019 [Hexamita inflata]
MSFLSARRLKAWSLRLPFPMIVRVQPLPSFCLSSSEVPWATMNPSDRQGRVAERVQLVHVVAGDDHARLVRFHAVHLGPFDGRARDDRRLARMPCDVFHVGPDDPLDIQSTNKIYNAIIVQWQYD